MPRVPTMLSPAVIEELERERRLRERCRERERRLELPVPPEVADVAEGECEEEGESTVFTIDL